MTKFEHKSHRAASKRLAQAVSLLHLAGDQLNAARQASPDNFHQKKLCDLALGVRALSLPLSRIASVLERGEYR